MFVRAELAITEIFCIFLDLCRVRYRWYNPDGGIVTLDSAQYMEGSDWSAVGLLLDFFESGTSSELTNPTLVSVKSAFALTNSAQSPLCREYL